MNNLEALQLACLMVGEPYPATLAAASLTRKPDTLLRLLDEKQTELCAESDWYFLQATANLRTHEAQSGTDGAVPSASLFSSAGASFDSGMPTSSAVATAKLTLNGASGWSAAQNGDRSKDAIRVVRASSTTLSIVDTFNRGTHATADLAWVMGVDEIPLATDCDRVSWVLCTRSGDSERHHFLEAVSRSEMERIRSNRSTYLDTGTPWFYAVTHHGAGSADYRRTLTLDPFPDENAVIHYGYMKKPATIYSNATVTMTVPDKWVLAVIYGAVLEWFAGPGQGAPNTPAGQTIPQRAAAVAKMYDEILGRMRAEPRIGKEQARMDPSSVERAFYSEQYGRTY